MKTHRTTSLLLAAAVTALALWSYGFQPRADGPAPIPIQDGKTLDFSGGSPVIRSSAADKAAMDTALREMAAASRTVTFPADATSNK